MKKKKIELRNVVAIALCLAVTTRLATIAMVTKKIVHDCTKQQLHYRAVRNF
jgi:hypothetical protein